jgi:transcriptional regulator with XRE-family HTH domain
MTQGEFASAIGMSARTLGDLERGKAADYDDDTRAAIESAVRWEPRSVERVLEGGKPRRARDNVLAQFEQAWIELSPDARRLLVLLAEGVLRDR